MMIQEKQKQKNEMI